MAGESFTPLLLEFNLFLIFVYIFKVSSTCGCMDGNIGLSVRQIQTIDCK